VNNGTLTVNGVALTVTGADASRTYGDPNPVFTGAIVGVRNGDNITASFGSAATPASPVGGYPIVPTLLDPDGKLANYAITVNNGTLTVGAAALSVTGADASRVYGGANPVFTGTLLGVKNGDNITATYGSAATPASPVGSHPIVPALVDPNTKLGNYTVTSNNGTLTVSAATLSVTANDSTRPYGFANPVLTGTITGVQNGDNITATYASSAIPASPVGSYPIVPTLVDPDGKLGNYTVTTTNGALLVTIQPLAITDPLNAQVLSCSAGAATPMITWLPAQYDKYKVYIGLDAGFVSAVSSGSTWLRTPSWKVSSKRWRHVCAGSTGTIYLKVRGLDRDVSKKNPARKLTGPTTVAGTQ
ncbi:MAG TPA: MBG domain-containing protein, partial [Gemmatimonadales bacterium]|nr:MBG domain-containing protein [Gemmatimonadales bacterium]